MQPLFNSKQSRNLKKIQHKLKKNKLNPCNAKLLKEITNKINNINNIDIICNNDNEEYIPPGHTKFSWVIRNEQPPCGHTTFSW